MSQINTTISDSAVVEPRVGRSLWGDAFRRLRRDRAAVVCFGIIVIYALVAIITPFALADWKDDVSYADKYAAPSSKYWLGADVFGRSVLQKTLIGAHVSMSVAFMANIIAIPLGMLLGAIAGYYGGWIDDLIVWMYTTLTCIPGIIRLIAIKFAFQDKVVFGVDLDGMAGLYIALGIMGWIGTCRLVRAETMRLRELDYVQASRACGRGRFSILLKHIMPNVMHIGIINFSLGFVGAISAEVILSYLNLGVANVPSWGKMIADANMDLISGRWWQLAAATGAIFFIVLAWNIFGDRLRDALDPKLKNA
ncbi:MAG: ABC transporter permease [Phycisphaerae bacterium]|nr:ABC transporter permease [Phycisphaerae bacterium]